jgi:hypothetical protein
MLLDVSERKRKMPSRINGDFDRSSIATNDASSAIAPVKSPIVLTSPQPYDCA